MHYRFQDRKEGGVLLAEQLRVFEGRQDCIVLGLPRGGLPVAYEVAQALGLPLDVLLVRKLGVPWQEELAFGAVASGGEMFLNDDLVGSLGLSAETVQSVRNREVLEIARRERLYRPGRPPLDLRGKTVILVDDGLATGATMHAAVNAVRRQGADRIVVAAPVAAAQSCRDFTDEGDTSCVCLEAPEDFYAVSLWYTDFAQTTDEEVREILDRSATGNGEAGRSANQR